MSIMYVGRCLCALAVVGLLYVSQVYARQFYQSVEILLSKQEKNIVGELLAYPQQKPAQVTSAIVSLQPGEKTGWHRHGVPVFARMLAGELTISYKGHETRTYRAGDTFMEAMNVEHDAINSGSAIARVLVVFMGAKGVPNTIPSKPTAATQD